MKCLRNFQFFSVNLLLYGALTIPTYAQDRMIDMVDGGLDSVRLVDSNPHLRRPCTPVPHDDSPYGLSCSEVTSPDRTSLLSPTCETPTRTDPTEKEKLTPNAAASSAQDPSEILKLGTEVGSSFPFKFPTNTVKAPTDILEGFSPEEMVRAIGEAPSKFSGCLSSLRLPPFSLKDVKSFKVKRAIGCLLPEPATVEITLITGLTVEFHIRKRQCAEAA